jgi:hypothetical protein
MQSSPVCMKTWNGLFAPLQSTIITSSRMVSAWLWPITVLIPSVDATALQPVSTRIWRNRLNTRLNLFVKLSTGLPFWSRI